MGKNTLNLALVIAGGFLIDFGFLHISSIKSFSLSIAAIGAIMFTIGFWRLK